ncbi:MAG: ABC transporter ATP-binding protein, partial [Granulosicoccus sp.]
HARSLGIGMVFQHFSLFESLSVVQNISLAVKGSLPQLSERITQIAKSFNMALDPQTLVHSLSVGERQRVEIVRCLLQQPRLLIMDEPTSVLPPQGVKMLFDILRKLSDDGCSILYISHKLDEIRALCDRASVLRQGRKVGTVNPAQCSSAELARMMIGRDIPHARHDKPAGTEHKRLQIASLSHSPDDPFGTTLDSISLDVYAGEIVGIAGVSGNGQNELMRLISGETLAVRKTKGTISIDGNIVNAWNPVQRRQAGLGFVPEERLGRGAVPDLSLAYNTLLTGFDADMTSLGFLRLSRMHERTRSCIRNNDVRCEGSNALAASLSGGNLQKYIVGREMARQPALLILSQPTWGVDVGAAASIRQALIDLRDAGAAILIVSEELEELFEVSDRLHVICDGRLSPSVQTADTSTAMIGQWMTGKFMHDADPA